MGKASNFDSKMYVLDTNVLLHEPLAYLSFQEHQVVIPMTVLEELDHIKDRKHDVSRDARVAIRGLDGVLSQATPEQMLQGVALPRNKQGGSTGSLIIVNDHLFADSISGLPGNENDHRIINCAVHLQNQHSDKKVILVTKDINMRLKAKGAGLKYVEDYRTDQLIDDIDLLTSGHKKIEGDFWQHVGQCNTEQHGRETVHHIPKDLIPDVFCNEYLLDDGDQFAARVKSYDGEHITIKDIGAERLMHQSAWGIKPKNIYQAMALDALLDTSIELVILTGPAGCGKTLLALACALEMVIEKGIYDKVIVTRNTPEIAESIGFLPGTEEEKMAPWLAAITDTLEVLHKGDENPISSRNYIMEKANIQFKSVNFMRGRSIQNAVVILQPRIGKILKFLPPCFYWPVEKVKRISLNMDFCNDFKHSHNSQSLQSICYLGCKYNTHSSNDANFWRAAS
ncbi:MAG: PhoH-like ATPase [Pseudoalteromonas tetraodonis]|jgi:PhoH-like ATPase|uniref:ATPase n=1 Tax=Pseudoalteromonas tetraodonis GFC TaxID=1315271 RepID=A0AA37W281_9GAMM|nr:MULTISPECIES: PIN domain-containing protein [Pseudoalteromonas]ADT69574.1 PhoH-like protein [Pseudoalteromonas sp. SM9913]ATD04291.1 PhoH-like ATPase [Pseudoalteromonas tetraodonis]MDN3435421.1 PIN domain-containing protein [Pseudoalteromonas sp. APC 3356]GEN39577.1 ATPase [Pseudoalteromonas tetraodonis GFC]GLQ02297.1 ATPase [Pseudoalteromonas tetraodonis GFC]